VLVLLPAWSLTREFDATTGFKELQIRERDTLKGQP
jgi:hypothetical protein